MVEGSTVSDEALVARAQRGDEAACEALVSRFRPHAVTLARRLFLQGAEVDDLTQEGMLGLWTGIRDFDPSRGARFAPFAELCIHRRIVSAIRAANRRKHFPINGAVPLIDANASRPQPIPGADVPLGRLSKFERFVLAYHAEGMSYDEISAGLSCSKKAVDNALQRAKKKFVLSRGDRMPSQVLSSYEET